MILRIRSVEVIGPQQLRLEFNTDVTKEVDLRPLLEGPVFVALWEQRYFATVSIDPVCGTVVWPNGADIAPEALLALPTLSKSTVSNEA